MTPALLGAVLEPERRPIVVLLLALGVLFASALGAERFDLWHPDHGGFTVDHLAVAANRSPEHGFLGYDFRFVNSAGEEVYQTYNRFPIGASLLIKAATLPFAGDLAAQRRAARVLMLAFFAAAMMIAYLAMRRLAEDPAVALTATLLAFSSFHALHYADMVASEASMDLFAVMLTFHGLVVFVHEARFPQLLAKTCLGVLIGWHVFALLLAFVVLGMAALWRRSDSGLAERSARLLRGRHALLAAVALAAGLLMLGLNFTLERAAVAQGAPWAGYGAGVTPPELASFRHPNNSSYRLVERQQAAWTELPSFRRMLKRLGLDADFNERHAGAVGWRPLLGVLLERAGWASIPRVLAHPRLGKRAVQLWGAFVFAGSFAALAFARHRLLMATLATFSVCWTLMLRGSVTFHPFEGMFLVTLALVFFSLALARVRSLARSRRTARRLMNIGGGGALLLFVLSSLQLGWTRSDAQEGSPFRALNDDMEAIRRLVPEDAGVIPYGATRLETQYLMTYFLGGRVFVPSLNGVHRQRADFVLRREHTADGAGLLTPENRYVLLYERARYDERYASLGDPVLTGGTDWSIHLVRNRLILATGEACSPRRRFEGEPPFFLETFPAEPGLGPAFYFHEVPNARRVEFNFQDSGFTVAGRCVAELSPPPYKVDKIRIGQFMPGAGTLWSKEARLDWGPSFAAWRTLPALPPLRWR